MNLRVLQYMCYTVIYMKVILLQDIKGIGKKGQVKDVAVGFARHFLFKRSLAQLATSHTVKIIKTVQTISEKKAKQNLMATEALIEKIDGHAIEIKEKANRAGRLYAAVSSAKIVKAVKVQLGADIKSNQIYIEKSIKDIGEHEIELKFPHSLEAVFTVIVNVV